MCTVRTSSRFSARDPVQSAENGAKLRGDVGVRMSCLVCHQHRELAGVACTECLEELTAALAITPEQVRMRGGEPTTAAVVDVWGRAHALRRKTIIGRVLEEDGLVILESTISRRHASIELRDNAWVVQDFGSANGTYVEGRRIEGETPLRDGERLMFGGVKFFFLDSVIAPPHIDTSALRGYTVRGPGAIAAVNEPNVLEIQLREPSGGGGGVAVFGGRPVQLTVPQFELVALLYQRARDGSSGYVQVSELVRTLSLESTEPTEDHVRQLVRRLRRVLAKADLPDLIESRYGLGYRLALLRA